MWCFRPFTYTPANFESFYGKKGKETYFSMKLIHGGEFTSYPERRYRKGKICFVDNVDIDKFSMYDMNTIMKAIGYTEDSIIYYHFRLPDGNFYFGLRPLGNDDDLRNLSQYVKEHKLIRVYTEHGRTRLLTYFLNPKPVRKVLISEELSEEDKLLTPIQQKKVKIPNLKQIECSATPPMTSLPLIVSPEYNRNRSWRKAICSANCSKRLFADEHDEAGINTTVDEEAENFDEVEVQRNRGEIFDMTLAENNVTNEEQGFNLIWGEEVHMNGDSDDNSNSEVESNISMQISDSSDHGEDFLEMHNSEEEDIEEDTNSLCEVDFWIQMDQNNDNDDNGENGAASQLLDMIEAADIDFDLHLYQHIMEGDVATDENVGGRVDNVATEDNVGGMVDNVGEEVDYDLHLYQQVMQSDVQN